MSKDPKRICLYPHCCCVGACTAGGPIPKSDPKKPLFKREVLLSVADRCHLSLKMQDADPGFHLSNEDMKMIEFALRFTAIRL